MNPNWTLDFDNSDWVELDLLELNGGSMQVNSGLVFEFDNTDANTADVARVGNANSGGGTQVINNDFVTTITYHDGSLHFLRILPAIFSVDCRMTLMRVPLVQSPLVVIRL